MSVNNIDYEKCKAVTDVLDTTWHINNNIKQYNLQKHEAELPIAARTFSSIRNEFEMEHGGGLKE